ncbi:MAG: hypothetical protein NZ534_07430, partial [Bacteroidia bacterium]|nr:hypothetical protein [Bacteroidia bacterium]
MDYARVNSAAGTVVNVPYTDFNALLTQPVIRADNVACTGLDVPFYAGVAGSWSFSPAQSSLIGNPGANPTARFANVAWYDVTYSANTYSDFWGILTHPNAVTPTIEVVPGTTVCRGSSVTFNGLGSGGTYTWTVYQGLASEGALIDVESGTSMTRVFSEPPGQYEVMLEVVSACCGPLPPVSVLITVVQAPNYTLQNHNICAGASVTLTPNPPIPPGATVTWQPGGFINNTITVSPTVTTVYTLNVVSPQGCPSNPVTATVTVRPRPTITGVTGPESVCQGQSASLTAQGGSPGVTYRWFRDGVLVHTSTNPTYSYTPFYNPPDTLDVIRVTASLNGCDGDTLTHYLMVVGTPTANITPQDPTVCLGQSVTLHASGGKRYEWSLNNNFNPILNVGDSLTFTPNAVGSTVVYIRSFNLDCPCIPNNGLACNSVTLSVVNAPQFNVPSDTTICPGASLTLTAQNTGSMPSIRRWETLSGTNLCPGGGNCVSITVNPATTTTYVFYARAGTGCEFRRQVTVNVGNPQIAASASANNVCPGTAVTLSASGGTSYTWSPATHLSATSGANVTFTAPTAAGTYNYTVTGTAVGGCTATAQVSITVQSVPSISVSASLNPICPGQLSTMTASGAGPGATYSWSWAGGGPINGHQSLTDSPPTTRTYTVTAVTASGCTTQTTFTLNVSPNPTITVNAPSVCVGQTANFTASGANTYVWEGPHLNLTTGGSVTASPPAAGTYNYTVTGTSAAGCTGTRTFTLTVNPLPNPTVSPVQTICAGQSANLTASGGTSYLWQPPNLAQQNITVSPAATTVYTVTVQDANGCSRQATTTVVVQQPPTITFNPPAPAICTG